jgi:hypothetical protein
LKTDSTILRKLGLLAFPIRFIVMLVVFADAVARPLYRPILKRLAALEFVASAEAAIARLPRLAILVLFAVPFAVAEPMKVFAMLLIAGGRLAVGIPLLLLSYVLTFLLVERIYHAGKPKLLSYGWFAWCMEYVWAVHARLTALRREVADVTRKWIAKLGI